MEYFAGQSPCLYFIHLNLATFYLSGSFIGTFSNKKWCGSQHGIFSQAQGTQEGAPKLENTKVKCAMLLFIKNFELYISKGLLKQDFCPGPLISHDFQLVLMPHCSPKQVVQAKLHSWCICTHFNILNLSYKLQEATLSTSALAFSPAALGSTFTIPLWLSQTKQSTANIKIITCNMFGGRANKTQKSQHKLFITED